MRAPRIRMPAAMQAKILQTIEAVRAGSALLYAGLYCVNSDCPCRSIEIYVKDYDRDFVPLIQRRGFTCAVCGSPVQLHWARTQIQEQAERDTDARRSVNCQRYLRDHADDLLLPIEVLQDDSLPE